MPKFYASCGSQSLVIDSECAEQAAMRLMDEVLSVHIWIYEDSGLSEKDRRDHLVLEALMHLGATICVSEQGAGRSDAGVYGVPEILDEWHRLMTALASALSSAGLSSARVLPEPPKDARSAEAARSRPPR